MKPPVMEGENVVINIDSVSHQGWGVGRYQGLTVFVPQCLPDEKVKVKILKVKKSFALADLVEIIAPSLKRISPKCAVYDSCGGCQIQHAQYEHQLEIKFNLIHQSLTRIGKLQDFVIHPVLGMDNPWSYRNRAQFHIQVVGNDIKLGFYRPGTHLLVPVEDCSLLPELFNNIIKHLKNQLLKLMSQDNEADLTGLHHIVLKSSRVNGEAMVIFVTERSKFPELDKIAISLSRVFYQITSVIQNINSRKSGFIFGPKWKLIWGKKHLKEQIDDLVFSIGPGSFVQVNTVQTEVLYQKVLEYANLQGNEEVIDVYCGIGTISLLLAKRCRQVYGIEEVKEAVNDARYNSRLNRIKNAKFLAGKAEQILPQMMASGVKPDLIVVDPPRKGCDSRVLDAIVGMNPPRIIYVSCDPGNLARDLKILDEKGYKTVEVQPVDMFPHTSHVECVVLMSRAKD
jgi:23S rRNA (uracil1939-C5)-methyltransferase